MTSMDRTGLCRGPIVGQDSENVSASFDAHRDEPVLALDEAVEVSKAMADRTAWPDLLGERLAARVMPRRVTPVEYETVVATPVTRVPA